MSPTTDYDIFLSYSNKDKSWVTEFVSALKGAGVKTWFDVHALVPGERRDDRLQQAFRESSIIVVILSENSVASPWTFFELVATIADKKRIISVLIGDIESKRIPSEAGKRIAQAIETTSLQKAQNVEG